VTGGWFKAFKLILTADIQIILLCSFYNWYKKRFGLKKMCPGSHPGTPTGWQINQQDLNQYALASVAF